MSGNAASFFDRDERTLLEILKRRSRDLKIQRFDLEDGQVQLRASLALEGLEETTGELVLFLDGDDVLLPGKIARQVGVLEHTGAE